MQTRTNLFGTPLSTLSMFSYKVGEAFLHMPQSRALNRLEQDQMSIDRKVALLALQADDCEVQMKGLKVVLMPSLAKLLIWTNENKKKPPSFEMEKTLDG